MGEMARQVKDPGSGQDRVENLFFISISKYVEVEATRTKTSVDQYWSKVCGEIQESIFTSIISIAL